MSQLNKTQLENENVNSFPNSSNVNSNDFDYYGAREMGGLYTELFETKPADTSVVSYASKSLLQQGQRNIWGGINELSFAWFYRLELTMFSFPNQFQTIIEHNYRSFDFNNNYLILIIN
jgi:hypothetical protein